MSYIDFMRKINSIVNENMAIKWTIIEVKKQAKTLGISLETDLEIIKLIEIAKKYEMNLI